MEAWDVIVLGDGPAALRSAAEAAKQGASTLVLSVNALGSDTHLAQEGLAASLQESNNRGHREDSIRAGCFLNDQDIVASRTADAGRQVDLLERWGVNFRRDAHGIPLVRKAPGHGMARNADAGDATGREIQHVLEEQCMRHGVTRRGDHLPLSLIHTNQSVSGVTVVDLVNGRIAALQAKAIILADGGFEGAFSHGAVGLGLDLALRAGVPLRDMEFIAHTPLGIKDTNMILPLGLLHDGATLHEANGSDIEIGDGGLDSLCQAVSHAMQPVIDARNLGDSSPWWESVFRSVKQRTGIDMNRQTIEIEPRPFSSLGGVTVDESGRAILSTWSRWFTGLYAAGDASCSGFHGADLLPVIRCLTLYLVALLPELMQVNGSSTVSLQMLKPHMMRKKQPKLTIPQFRMPRRKELYVSGTLSLKSVKRFRTPSDTAVVQVNFIPQWNLSRPQEYLQNPYTLTRLL